MNNLLTTPEHASGAALAERRLTASEFQKLTKVPAAVEWFANLDNPRTRRAYQGDVPSYGCPCKTATGPSANGEQVIIL
ncbi:hypothetical protein N5O88_16500 [Pseudomonas sp. GD03721]|nr:MULTISPECIES: hypothetical protein [unclassified Pseudomonas]MDH1443845.1 hypothetical protein [Pseudomonas sp. GD03722]WGG03891.1 hypothetical protein N5O88_16500 [Pseudomonas sp. GD03721]WGG08057.1 hypothetical protein N5O87_16510 [Pseudomonas sp. GD03919]